MNMENLEPNSEMEPTGDGQQPESKPQESPKHGPMGSMSRRERNKSEAPTTDKTNQDGTEAGKGEEPVKKPTSPKEPKEDVDIDYKTKFSESSKEGMRLVELLKNNGIDPKTGERIDETIPTTPDGSDNKNLRQATEDVTDRKSVV